VRRHWKKLALFLAAVLTCAFLATVARSLTTPPQPSYQGRSLSQWVLGHTDLSFTQPMREAEADALQHMGTNVLPYLVEWAVQAPKWRQPLDRLCRTFHPLTNNNLVASAYSSARRKQSLAKVAFSLLGTNAAPALPELARIAASTRNTGQQTRARENIASILIAYPDPDLNTFLSHPDPIIRSEAARILKAREESRIVQRLQQKREMNR
jgi:hypothetical protein